MVAGAHRPRSPAAPKARAFRRGSVELWSPRQGLHLRLPHVCERSSAELRSEGACPRVSCLRGFTATPASVGMWSPLRGRSPLRPGFAAPGVTTGFPRAFRPSAAIEGPEGHTRYRRAQSPESAALGTMGEVSAAGSEGRERPKPPLRSGERGERNPVIAPIPTSDSDQAPPAIGDGALLTPATDGRAGEPPSLGVLARRTPAPNGRALASLARVRSACGHSSPLPVSQRVW